MLHRQQLPGMTYHHRHLFFHNINLSNRFLNSSYRSFKCNFKLFSGVEIIKCVYNLYTHAEINGIHFLIYICIDILVLTYDEINTWYKISEWRPVILILCFDDFGNSFNWVLSKKLRNFPIVDSVNMLLILIDKNDVFF